jgi:aldose 1-epimerase
MDGHIRGPKQRRGMARWLVFALLSGASFALHAAGAVAGSVDKAAYGTTKAGESVDIYTLSNDKGMSVEFLSYGALITAINAPDRRGRIDDVVLGMRNLADAPLERGHPLIRRGPHSKLPS